MEEIKDLIDQYDNVIGTASRSQMRKNNLLHRGVAIFILNSKGEIFVHKRTKTKDLYPSYYDMTCGGGVQSGETYEQAAKRELKEETGIKNVEIKPLFKLFYKSETHQVMQMNYTCTTDQPLTLQKEEIEFGSFMTIEELEALMQKESFGPNAVEAYKKWKK